MLTFREVLEYEVKSSWWAGYISWPWLQALAGWYYGRKVRRKYDRYRRIEQMRLIIEQMKREDYGVDDICWFRKGEPVPPHMR